jgi:hypothetical protein
MMTKTKPPTLAALVELYLLRCQVEGKSPNTIRAYGETLGRFPVRAARQHGLISQRARNHRRGTDVSPTIPNLRRRSSVPLTQQALHDESPGGEAALDRGVGLLRRRPRNGL